MGVERTSNAQTVSLLVAARNHDPSAAIGGGDVSVVSDRALLSEAGPTGAVPDVKRDDTPTGNIDLYVVRKNDTLSQIASMFDVSVDTIVWANDISGAEDISPGDTLVILPVSGIRHTVDEGETLSGIVDEYGGDIKEVREYNGLSEDATLAVGDTITIPDGEQTGHDHDHESSAESHSDSSQTNTRSAPSYSGYYRRPINGGVRTQGHHGYNAVDLAAPAGTAIMAAADGTVIVSKNRGWNGGYGKYIVIKHDNGTQTLYSHNSQNIVGVGQRVVQGQIIGYIGSTGKSTGSHVHFEIRGARNPF